jgi:hypothetical protein
MSLDIIQLNNEGFKIIVNVKNKDGTTKDLTGALQLKIKARSAIAQTGKNFTAAFETNGADGKVSYTVAAGQIDALGVWSTQAYYEESGFKGHTEAVESFEVKENLA